MKAQCLPFNQIPHTTALFSDFLSGSPKVRQFYPHSARFAEWFQEAAAKLHYDPARREQVAGIFERQNKSWGASTQTLQNIARFRNRACTFVTGQQVGLFGGPLFSVLKALTAIKFAEDATRGGVDCVPVFWLATEDHDLAEVNHIDIPGSDFSLQRLLTTTQGVPDASVGMIPFGPEIEAAVETAAQLLGDSDITTLLREAYRPGETFGSAFARLFARLFAEWGLILLDGSDAELRQIAQPIFHAAIERASELDEALLARGRALEADGYHQQVKVTTSSTLLFAIQDGARVPIHRRLNNGPGSAEFTAGKQKLTQAELLNKIATTPHAFSPNVLLRPVVQDYVLPTLAYAGGAAEVAYFAQAGVVYETLLERQTPVISRLSATLVSEKAQALLERYGLMLQDIFSEPSELRENLAGRILSGDLQTAFESASIGLDKSLGEIGAALQRLDATLTAAVETAASKMHYQLEQLRGKAARAQLLRDEVVARHAGILSNSLYPHKTLQEREIAGIYFVARYGRDLLRHLHDSLCTDCVDHQIIPMAG